MRDPAIIVVAYLLGCAAAGYYLVRWRTGGDVRGQGTGSIGATNAMRALGRPAFAIVFVVDVLKGALAVGLARWVDAGTTVAALAGVAVIAGHIWPAQLRFRGGKGVATAFGAALAFDALIPVLALAIAGVAFVVGRRFVLAGLVGTTLAPLIALVTGRDAASVLGIGAMAIMVLIGHRRNIRDLIREYRERRMVGAARPVSAQAPPEAPVMMNGDSS